MRPVRTVNQRSLGALTAAVGFILSPLSWWNDLVVNIPLALGFAWAASWFYRPAFQASFILGYWLTNVLGLVLLHRGGEAMLGKTRAHRRKQLAKDLGISLAYTALIVVLVRLEILAPLPEYLARADIPRVE